MKAIHISIKAIYSLKTVGIDSKGNIKEFELDSEGDLFCSYEDLVSLKIFKNINNVYCSNNKLTELLIPEGVNRLSCYNNLLTKLNIPNSVKDLVCDRHVLGLDKVDCDCKIILY